MKKSGFILWLLVFTFTRLLSQIPGGYYNNAVGKTGAELKTALHLIIKDHTSVSYSGLWSAFSTTDKKSNGKVWDMYSDVPGGTPAYEFTFGSDQCGSYSGEGDCYNREHSFPKSWFNEGTPMYSDLFHLVPTDGYVNGRRSNYIFGEVSTVSWTSTNGSKLGTCTLGGTNTTAFEPIDAYKGDFARTYLYMVTRYEDRIVAWDGYGTEGSIALDGQTYPGYVAWYIDMLLAWHQQDPVDQKEINRNNAIYGFQDNRNPFIDHPEYAGLIWGDEDPWEILISNILQTPLQPSFSDSVQVQASITSTFPLSTVKLLWGLSASTDHELTMQLDNNQYIAQIPVQAENITVYYKIEATDDQAHTNSSSIFSYTVSETNPQITILSETFTACPPSGWNMVSLSSDKDWTCSAANGNMEVNGYGGTEPSDEWLISPVLDLSVYTSENFSFQTYTQYTDINHPPLKIYWSNSYPGSGNPSMEQWNELEYNFPLANSMAWTPGGNIDLSQISGNQVYIAFRYVSSGTGSSSSSLWKIDDFLLKGSESNNQPPVISNLQYSPQQPVAFTDISITAVVTDPDQNLDSVKIWYGNSSTNLSQSAIMELTENNTFQKTINCGQGPGFYFQVEAIDSAGIQSVSEIIEIVVNGIEILNANNFKVYPNPADRYIHINNISGTLMEVEILSVNGMIVKKSKPGFGNVVIPVEMVEAGVYIVKINAQGQSFYKRLIIN